MNETNLSQGHDKLIENIVNTIYRAKKAPSIDKFNEIINSLYSEAKTAQLSVIQKFSIMFYSFYNHLTPKKENKDVKKFIELSNFMINNFQEKNIFPYLEIQINELVPKEFENYKIFNKEKKV